MDNNDVIEILDDVNDSDITSNNSGVPDNGVATQVDNASEVAAKVNAAPQTPASAEPQAPASVAQTTPQAEVKPVESQSDSREITIENDSQDSNSKSGLTFVIIICILLVAFIIALPYISKLIP